MIVLSRVKRISEIAVVLVLIGFLVLAFNVQFANAEPRTWIVDDDGPADFHTIREAIIAASSGDIIFVRNGTYYEHVVVNKALRLVGEDISATVIDGNGITPLTITANNATVSSFTMQGGGPGWESGIYVDGACYCNITNNNVKDNNIGIYLFGADNNTVSENIVINNGDGIYLETAKGNSISGNNITENFVRGIALGSSFSNSIFGNNITSSIYGICLTRVRYNCFWGNNIKNNELGMWGRQVYDNRIYGNNITANTEGIYIDLASENTFYHNNFINNKPHAETVSGWTFNNTWDDGYPSGGNYWSGYSGVDLYKGPYQNQTGSDGISDTTYVIDIDDRDKYPLMKPYPWDSHDIGVTYISGKICFQQPIVPLKPIVGEGLILKFGVFLMNYGSSQEVFNVTVYANKIVIGFYTNIALKSKNSTILNFTWDTKGFAKGEYNITAYAASVPNETDVEDNNYTTWILVSWIGDWNGDGVVNEDDLWHFCEAFIDYYKIHVKDPKCDFDDDCDIDEDDLWTMCGGFIDYLKAH
jgi:parallel beta-helix repeat protein